MKFSAVTALAAAGVFAATLGSAALASAQTDPQSTGGDTSGGTTSGPAAGTNVVPSTVTQKKRSPSFQAPQGSHHGPGCRRGAGYGRQAGIGKRRAASRAAQVGLSRGNTGVGASPPRRLLRAGRGCPGLWPLCLGRLSPRFAHPALRRCVRDHEHEAPRRSRNAPQGAGTYPERRREAEYHPHPGQCAHRRARGTAGVHRHRHGDRHRRGSGGQYASATGRRPRRRPPSTTSCANFRTGPRSNSTTPVGTPSWGCGLGGSPPA